MRGSNVRRSGKAQPTGARVWLLERYSILISVFSHLVCGMSALQAMQRTGKGGCDLG